MHKKLHSGEKPGQVCAGMLASRKEDTGLLAGAEGEWMVHYKFASWTFCLTLKRKRDYQYQQEVPGIEYGEHNHKLELWNIRSGMVRVRK